MNRNRISWKRALLPGVVLLVGLFLVAPVAGTLSGKLSSVTENDQAAFLPDSAESTRSLDLETRFAGTQDIPARIVWERSDGLTEQDLAAVAEASTRLSAVDGVAGPASPPIPSEDGQAVQVVVPLPGDNTAFETLPGIVDDVTAAAQVDGLPSYVTGPGGQFADFASAFEGIDGRLLFTTVGVILVIYIELGQISPPIGINLFVIQSIWDGKLSEVVWGTIPFHLLMFVLLVMLVLFPEIALWLPYRMSAPP